MDSMSDCLCHCRARSQAVVRDESKDELIPDRMASPASEGSYHTPVHTDDGIEEVVRKMSEETAINPTSSSLELEYEEENQVAIPIPPPSASPVRGQCSTHARCWVPYNGRCRPVRGMQTIDPNVVFGSDFHGSAVIPECDDASMSAQSRGIDPNRICQFGRLNEPYALVGPACSRVLPDGPVADGSDDGVVSDEESGSGSSLSRFSERPPLRRTASDSRSSSGSRSGHRDGRRGNHRECLGENGRDCSC